MLATRRLYKPSFGNPVEFDLLELKGMSSITVVVYLHALCGTVQSIFMVAIKSQYRPEVCPV